MGERPGTMIYFNDILPLFDALQDEEIGQFFKAVVYYGKFGEIPDFSNSPVLSIAWGFIKPKIDRDGEKYEKEVLQRKYAVYCREMKKAGNDPLSFNEWERSLSTEIERYPTATATETATETATPIGDADGRGVGEETAPTSPLLMGNARNYYQKMIDGHPSPSSMAKLDNFEKMMGTEVCIMAIDAAIDAGKKSWAYIGAILASKQEKGVRSRADWEWEEAKHIDRKKTEGTSNPFQEMLNDMKDNRGDIIIAEQVEGNG